MGIQTVMEEDFEVGKRK